MVRKLHRNPSTGKLARNPVTGKLHTTLPLPGDKCEFCTNNLTSVRWTSSGVSLCCGSTSPTVRSGELIGASWDSYLNTVVVLGPHPATDCIMQREVEIPASTLHYRLYTSETDCTGPFTDTEIRYINYVWAMSGTEAGAQIQLQRASRTTVAFGAQWQEVITDTPPWDCVGDHGNNLTRVTECELFVPSSGGTILIEDSWV